MKVTVKNTEWDGNPTECGKESSVSLIRSSVFVVESGIPTVGINVDDDAALVCGIFSSDSIAFEFNKDHGWCGSYHSEITFTAENEEELALIKNRNRFTQHEDGQYVFKLLPFADIESSEFIASYENGENRG